MSNYGVANKNLDCLKWLWLLHKTPWVKKILTLAESSLKSPLNFWSRWIAFLSWQMKMNMLLWKKSKPNSIPYLRQRIWHTIGCRGELKWFMEKVVTTLLNPLFIRTLKIRKEVFSPSETLNSPLAIHLVFCQVIWLLILSGLVFQCFDYVRLWPTSFLLCAFGSPETIGPGWRPWLTSTTSTWRTCLAISTSWAPRRTSSTWQKSYPVTLPGI